VIDRRLFVRPSSLPGLDLCPGKALMEARAVDRCPEIARIEHPQAKQGTIGHEIVAQTLSIIYHGPDGKVNPAEALSKMASALAQLDSWSADSARRCVSYAVALVDREIASGYLPQVFVEMHLPGADLGLSFGGTADVVILSYISGKNGIQRVIIQDHKLGWLDQGQASEHLQLAAYAAMAFRKFEPLQDVEIHLAQGRRKEFSAASFTRDSIEMVSEKIRAVTKSAWGSFPELNPNIESCRYCKALSLCAAARERIMNASQEASLFGIEDVDKVKLMEDSAIAKRFIEEVSLLQKEMTRSNQAEVTEVVE